MQPSDSNSIANTQLTQNQVPQNVAQSPQSTDYSAFTQKLLVNRSWLVMGIFGLVVIAVCIFFLMNATVANKSTTDSLSILGMIVGVAAAVVGLSFYAYKYQQAVIKRLQLFLAANNWSLTDNKSFDNVATSLLGVGHSQRIKLEFSGDYRGLPFSAVIYEYITGEGKNQETHFFSDLRFTLSKPFPLVVLDDKKNSLLFFRDLPDRIRGGQSLQFEGDFNSRFNVTVMPGSQQDVLQLLTPNFMSDLMDCPVHVDIELEANELYLINHHNARSFNEQNLRTMFAMADVVIKNINEASVVWQASSSAETIQAMTDSALSARNETLLHPRRVTITSIIFVVIIIIFQIIAHTVSRHN